MNTDVVNLQNSTNLSQRDRAPSKEMGKNEFLRLLMTQLSAQDPLKPMEATEFTAQLSQFASLEQLTGLGSKLDNLITISGASNAANAVSLLGKEVRVENNQIKGDSKVFYDLDVEAASAQIEVRDKDGRVVHTHTGAPTKKGLNEVDLQGLEPGNYTISVLAKDGQNKEIKATRVSTLEKVKSVNFLGNIPAIITESGLELPASQVYEIRAASGESGS